jgi:hypothetical protein
MNTTFSDTLFKKISDLDTKIFKNKAIISVLNKNRFEETACAEFIFQRNIFWRILIKDEYVIYKNIVESFFSKKYTNQEEIDRHLSVIACHEVRHRFQMHNPRKITSVLFFEKNKDNPLVSSAIRDTEIKGYQSEQIRLLELDANLIGQLASIAYWNKEIDLSEIVCGDQDSIVYLIENFRCTPL